MSAADLEINFDLPWPHCWTQMQWEIAVWLARHGDRARVEVVWNESQLLAQVPAQAFQDATVGAWRVLSSRLNDGCQWRVAKLDLGAAHRLVLGRQA